MNKLRLFFLCVLVTGCGMKDGSEKEVTIRGKIKFPQPGKVQITELLQEGSFRESEPKPEPRLIEVGTDGSYETVIPVKEAGYYQIDFYSKQIINVILDKSDLEVNVDGNDPGGAAEVKGSPDMDLIDKVTKMVTEAQDTPESRKLQEDFNEAVKANDQAKIKELQDKYVELITNASQVAADVIRTEKPSLGVIHLLRNAQILDPEKFMPIFVEQAEKFRTEWGDTRYGKDFVSYVVKLKRTAVGQPAPEISLPDTNGKILTLSSFKGKYLLVDFWAKWCGPCRRENPNVVNAYNKFKDKGFDILGVSLDRNRADWLQAIDEDGLTWNHVSDLKYFDCQAALDYNINAIPFSILVDPTGVIIAKNLRGEELDRKLTEVLIR